MKEKLKNLAQPDFTPAQLNKWVDCGLNFSAWQEPSPFRSKGITGLELPRLDQAVQTPNEKIHGKRENHSYGVSYEQSNFLTVTIFLQICTSLNLTSIIIHH